MIDRRTALILGGGTIASGLAATPLSAAMAGDAIWIIDPALALAHPGAVALQGDPVRVWHSAWKPGTRRIEGITRWGDYMALRGLVTDTGLRIRQERIERLPDGSSLVRWSAA